MITPRGTIRLLGLVAIVVFGSLSSNSPTDGAENKLRPGPAPTRSAQTSAPVRRENLRSAPEQPQLKSAPSGRTAARPRRSLYAAVAEGKVLSDPPTAPLDGSLVKGTGVEAVGFHEASCGPVCDCAECEASCGIEAACGVEASCGIEVGCGIGAALDRFNTCDGCATGCADCETACGVEEIFVEGPGCGTEAIGECPCDECSACEMDCIPLFLPMMRINWNRFQFFVGTEGFKGPLNFTGIDPANAAVQSGSGSFGFQQGFNIGHAFKSMRRFGLAGQFGMRATQSNLSGAEFTEDTRHQIFLTTGLFRRVDQGLQYGLVFDYLNQDWYFQSDNMQLRGELSWRSRGCHVFGFRGAASIHKGTSQTIIRDSTGNRFASSLAYRGTDQYRFFYRYLLGRGGQWNAFAGWTNNDDGLLGTSLNVAVHHRLMLATTSTFLIPREGDESGGHREEGWNIGIALVFRPGGPMGCGRYGQPMFDVADNGSFMVDLR